MKRLALTLVLLLSACSSATRHNSSAPTTRAPRPNPSPTTEPSGAGTIVVHLDLPSDTMTAGGSMSGTITIDNNTGTPVEVGCRFFGVDLGNDKIKSEPVWPAVACVSDTKIPTGRSTFPVTVPATYSGCDPNDDWGANRLPRCPPGGGMPPLPPGEYRATFIQRDTHFPAPPPRLIHVVPADHPTGPRA
jgi:hypothetical protein